MGSSSGSSQSTHPLGDDEAAGLVAVAEVPAGLGVVQHRVDRHHVPASHTYASAKPSAKQPGRQRKGKSGPVIRVKAQTCACVSCVSWVGASSSQVLRGPVCFCVPACVLCTHSVLAVVRKGVPSDALTHLGPGQFCSHHQPAQKGRGECAGQTRNFGKG